MRFYAEKMIQARIEGIARDAVTGRRLRKLRKSKGITGSWVAKKIGVNETLLCHLEKGRRHWTPELVAAYLKAIGEEPQTSTE